MMDDEYVKKAADLGFDVTKQFLTLAFAGIAFVVGLSFSAPGAVSTLMLWAVISVFGGSAVLGLLFLMRGVHQLSEKKSFDVYTPSLRWLASLQIIAVIMGTGCLAVILKSHSGTTQPIAHTMEIRLDSLHSVVYPIDPDKNTTVEVDGGKVKIASTSTMN
jgi:hypothetical protein